MNMPVTAREVEVLKVIAGGGTNCTAAETLMVSEATVKTHLVRAYENSGSTTALPPFGWPSSAD